MKMHVSAVYVVLTGMLIGCGGLTDSESSSNSLPPEMSRNDMAQSIAGLWETASDKTENADGTIETKQQRFELVFNPDKTTHGDFKNCILKDDGTWTEMVMRGRWWVEKPYTGEESYQKQNSGKYSFTWQVFYSEGDGPTAESLNGMFNETVAERTWHLYDGATALQRFPKLESAGDQKVVKVK